jgi:hypothetical protein
MPRSRCTANEWHGRALPWLLALLAVGAAAWVLLAPQHLPAFLRPVSSIAPHAGPPLYKWRDAHGVLHVTDTPPVDRPYETVRYDPALNVVPTVVPPRERR